MRAEKPFTREVLWKQGKGRTTAKEQAVEERHRAATGVAAL
jgi:hypothetical protein